MNALSIVGVVIAFGAILVGQYLEGGHLITLLNGPAILIVRGGTVGAIMLQSPLPVFMRSLRMLVWLFRPLVQPMVAALEKLIGWSRIARKEGLLGLEAMVEGQTDPFLRRDYSCW
jgi:chemotaxis protein MotA